MPTFGEQIGQVMAARGIGPRALERVSGVPNATIARIVNGKHKNPSWTVARKLAHALILDLNDIAEKESACRDIDLSTPANV